MGAPGHPNRSQRKPTNCPKDRNCIHETPKSVLRERKAAKVCPKDNQTELRGTPKDAKRVQSRPEGAQRHSKRSQRCKVYLYKLPINHQSGPYITLQYASTQHPSQCFSPGPCPPPMPWRYSHPSFHGLVGRSVGQLVDWSVCCLVGQSVGRTVGRMVGWMIGWLDGRLVRWTVGGSARWPDGRNRSRKEDGQRLHA